MALLSNPVGQIDTTDDKWTLKIDNSDFTSISVVDQQVEIERRSPVPYTYNFTKENYHIPEDFDRVTTTVDSSGGATIVACSNSIESAVNDFNLFDEETLAALVPLSVMLVFYTVMLFYGYGCLFHSIMVARAGCA
uniref:Uncharacterized protein n=1 Tax=Strigamia maritima TaxID=126957 RepID=T1IWE1_STRMM